MIDSLMVATQQLDKFLILGVSCLCIVLGFLALYNQHFCELQQRYNFSPFHLWYSTEDAPESPSGPGSPKVALLPPVLKKVPSDKEKDGQNSPTIRSFSQEAAKRSPAAGELQERKQRSLSKDGHQGSKSSDSGEEADKDFIFV
ncbi:PREDICTED: leucine-rich repeat-containing protein 16A-like [Tinamus guttatus]|uniref:leucine-rich repeat-containing protein 16A-like n=1 Tax=Tinamus guttatus TaxID=94827 RepID=UPI00052EAD4A|nr:PREDICTED: leucine-rich repeat-containing protein 16A-like [Tinamus guttatus]